MTVHRESTFIEENFAHLSELASGIGVLVSMDVPDRLKGQMNGIDEFVIRGGQGVTAGEMEAFRRRLPFLKVKAETLDVPEFPHLQSQIRFLITRRTSDEVYPCSDLEAIAETVFALITCLGSGYHSGFRSPRGFADDSAVLRAVPKGHESEFRAFSKKFD
jgi:hypothetical protein